jgi:hypothetical protein
MPLNLQDDLPKSFPQPQYKTHSNFKKGVVSLIDKSRLQENMLEQADNIFLVEDGQPSLRPGIDWYGTAAPNSQEIDGFDYFDFAGVVHLVIVAGGTVYRSTNDGQTWTACTGATLTDGLPVLMNQYNNYLYLTNGTDNVTLYDGTTVLTQYTTLATPAAPTVAENGTLSGSGFTYYYKVARVNTIGFSEASTAGVTSIQTNLSRDNWSTTNYASITTPLSIATQTRWDIYMSTDNVDYYYLDSIASGAVGTAATYNDVGTAVVVTSTTAPTDDTTTGPKVKELVNVGSRMYGVRDTTNRYRIWFSSANSPKGAFSSAYDGGWLDWQEGGKYIPVQVADYRDGKGTPLATVWCDSADGQGCIIQVSLDTVTVGDISVTVPSAYKLPGSRGTPAPGSVVNVLNDYMFYNSQAFYNLGSRLNFQNLLSTDESSANIRPTVKQITNSGDNNIASVYYDAKVYFSVPYGSTTNNNTAVYDTERKAWLPYAFTVGFKKFLRYTDTDGSQHLLAVKPGDTRLSEIGSNIQGDYNTAFTSILQTGLYPTTKNRFEFQWTEEAEIEFSNPSGDISIELIGLERARGFSSQGTATITSSLTTTGWDTFLWDTTEWDDTSTAIERFSESSVKRYFRLGRELNSVQWRITTSGLDSGYVLRTLQTWGTNTLGSKPRSWRLDRI